MPDIHPAPEPTPTPSQPGPEWLTDLVALFERLVTAVEGISSK